MLGTLSLTGRSVSRLPRQLRLSIIFTVTFNQLVRQVYPKKEYPSSGTEDSVRLSFTRVAARKGLNTRVAS